MDVTLQLFWIVNVVLFCIAQAAEYSYTIEVAPGAYNCFFQTVNSTIHKSMEIDYQVINGGDLNINFVVLSGTEVLVRETKKVDATHRIIVKESGDYQMCFDNSFSYKAPKVVFFELFLMDKDENYDETSMIQEFGPMKKEYSDLGFHMQQFQSASNNIKNRLNTIEYHQSLLRAYEARDRAVMNANLERVTLWSAINSIVLVLVGLLQVYMIRSLFDDNSKVGRLLRK